MTERFRFFLVLQTHPLGNHPMFTLHIDSKRGEPPDVHFAHRLVTRASVRFLRQNSSNGGKYSFTTLHIASNGGHHSMFTLHISSNGDFTFL